MDITIQYDDREVVALNRLVLADAGLRLAMRSVASTLKGAAEESFQSRQAPDGTPRDDLFEHTKRRRAKKGKWFIPARAGNTTPR